MSDELRKDHLGLLKHDSYRVLREYTDTKSKLYSLSVDKRYLATLLEGMDLTDEEMESEFQIIMEDAKFPSDDEVDQVLTQVQEYIKVEYEKGKYDGRELSGLFRRIFSMIGESALQKFDEII